MSSMLVNIVNDFNVNPIISLIVDLDCFVFASLSILNLYLIGVLSQDIKAETKEKSITKYEQLNQDSVNQHLNDYQKTTKAEDIAIRESPKYNKLIKRIIWGGFLILMSCLLFNKGIKEILMI